MIDNYIKIFNITKYPLYKNYTYNITFYDGARVEIWGKGKDKFSVEIFDDDNIDLNYKSNIKSNMSLESKVNYFINWHIKIIKNNKLIVDYKIDLKNQNVVIIFKSKSLGDILAWIPYVEEFRKKHDCNVYCHTVYNYLFEKEYHNIHFVDKKNNIENVYAVYGIGWYTKWKNYEIKKNNGEVYLQGINTPNDPKKIPLQQLSSDILGLDFKEIKPLIIIPKFENFLTPTQICNKKCYGIDNYDGYCCCIEDRNFIIGRHADADVFIRDLSKKLNKEVKKEEVFYSYEEGKKLFPNKESWQNFNNYPAFRVDLTNSKKPCIFYNKNSKSCDVYDIRPQTCKKFECEYLKNNTSHFIDNKIERKYVCIAEFSTGYAKFWNYPTRGSNVGWQIIVDWLNNQGYDVMSISKEKTKLKNVIDRSGDYSLLQRIYEIKNCEFFIGLASGLSWLAWAVGKKVVMISGFSDEICEFKENNIRVQNLNVCHGCWHRHDIEHDNFKWCPEKKDFECTKSITPRMIIDKIIDNKLIDINKEFNFDEYNVENYISPINVNNIIKDSKKNSVAYILTGMARSGTSLFAEYMHKSGIHMGDYFKREEIFGKYEDIDFCTVEQKELERQFDIPPSYPFVHEDFIYSELFHKEGMMLYDQKKIRNSSNPWGWKNPKNCLFINYWAMLDDDLNFIFIFRKPESVINSCNKMWNISNLPLARSEYFKTYIFFNQQIINFIKNNPFKKITLFPLEELIENPNDIIYLINKQIDYDFDPLLFKQLFDDNLISKISYNFESEFPELAKQSKLVYNELYSMYEYKKSLIEIPKFNISFIDGLKIENLNDIEYSVDIYGKSNNCNDPNDIIYSSILQSKQSIIIDVLYYKNWIVNIKHNNDIIYNEILNLKNRNVLIIFISNAVGDTLAWIPYVEEFRKKHNCNVYCQTNYNYLFKKEYPNINFINFKEGKNHIKKSIYTRYFIGLFKADDKSSDIKLPNDSMIIPLQQTSSDILGLDFKEIKPLITTPNKKIPIKEKYVCISEFSRHKSKYWNYPNGWQIIVDWLNDQGYKVMVISKEKTKLKNIIDHSGNFSLKQRINEINHCEFMITIATGLAWIAWSLNKKVVMISGFSYPYTEFQQNNIRVINENVCHGCYNRLDIDWIEKNKCPEHHGTKRSFECTKNITPKMVKDKISTIIN